MLKSQQQEVFFELLLGLATFKYSASPSPPFSSCILSKFSAICRLFLNSDGDQSIIYSKYSAATSSSFKNINLKGNKNAFREKNWEPGDLGSTANFIMSLCPWIVI